MNETVELNLAFILFLPWYGILATLYWVYPRKPRTLRRWTFDVLSLTAVALVTVASTQWSVLNAGTEFGAIWPQILATALSYGVFLAAMTLAFLIRRYLIVAPYLAANPSHQIDTSPSGASA